MAPFHREIVIAGLIVNVYTQYPPVQPGRLGDSVAVLILLHNGLRSAKKVEWVVKALFDMVAFQASQDPNPSTDLVVITFDHRNHGTRLVDPFAHNAWSNDKNNNTRHAVDMFAVQVGSAHDVSFLIDFLPSYLYPAGERQVSHWMVSGISLGGHSTWIALAKDSRIQVGIPIVGCPDYHALITYVAEQAGVALIPPRFPPSLPEAIASSDPLAILSHSASNAVQSPFWGKKILALYGGKDTLVPPSLSEKFFADLDVGPEGLKARRTFEDAGHTCTKDMVTEMGAFIWREVLAQSPAPSVPVVTRSNL